MTWQKEPAPSAVLVLGGRGYLGRHFRALYPDAAAPDIDVADPAALRRVMEEARPDVVVNCAGKTGRPNVDWCEGHPLETARSNVTGALVVAEECLRRGAYLAHLSTGCIYEGDNGGRGFSEDDPPNFFGSVYSRTKASAELALRCLPVLLLRLRMPFDGSAAERNLLMKLRGYPRVLAEPNSMTHLPDFLRAAQALIARREVGAFNVVNEGATSPYEIMLRYRAIVDPHHAVERLPLARLGEVARAGRSNCVLNTGKLRRAGLSLPPLQSAVEAALRALGEELRRQGALAEVAAV